MQTGMRRPGPPIIQLTFHLLIRKMQNANWNAEAIINGGPSYNLHFILLMQNGMWRPGLPITPEINHVLPNWTLSFHSDNADGRQIVWYGLVHISSK